jgi:hypothetical protein
VGSLLDEFENGKMGPKAFKCQVEALKAEGT